MDSDCSLIPLQLLQMGKNVSYWLILFLVHMGNICDSSVVKSDAFLSTSFERARTSRDHFFCLQTFMNCGAT